jgi:hypothetical protein
MQEIGGHLSPWHASAWRSEAEARIGAELQDVPEWLRDFAAAA